MSIAVSAIVRPSRLLLMAVGVMIALSVSVGIAIGLGGLGELSVAARFSLCIFSFFLAFVGFYHGIRQQKTIHIDISDTGRMRIVDAASFESCAKKKRPHVMGGTRVVQLMKSSTIWPHLLLLLLQTEDGDIVALPILPDSVSCEAFRALSVACRWIAQRNDSPECENF